MEHFLDATFDTYTHTQTHTQKKKINHQQNHQLHCQNLLIYHLLIITELNDIREVYMLPECCYNKSLRYSYILSKGEKNNIMKQDTLLGSNLSPALVHHESWSIKGKK